MNERTLCGAIKANGKDCDDPVPSGAPVNLCLKHMQQAYLYIRDIIEEWDPQPFNYDPRRFPEPAVVYYVRFGDRIKIGTSSDVWARIAHIPCDRLLATEPGGFALERERHYQFRAFRVNRNGEWFRDCPEIRKHVDALRQQYGDPVENRIRPTRRALRAEGLEDAPRER